MRRTRGMGCLGLIGVVVLIGFASCGSGSDSPPVTEPTPATTPTSTRSPKADRPSPQAAKPEAAEELSFVDVGAAKRAVDDLAVKGRAPMTGYSREAFGTAWSDTNDNGCDTRNDILRRDLRSKEVVDCVVMSGILDDPYSGQKVRFVRGPVTSLEVQIDHVVSMGNAWATGAAYWSDAQRERFANDRRNLLAVRGDLNMQKSDGDAATWLPPRKAFRCTYVSMQVMTKQRYELWVTPAEKAAMQRVLATC